MKKYNILMSREISYEMIIEAENKEEASKIAHDDLNEGKYIFVVEETVDRQEILNNEEQKG